MCLWQVLLELIHLITFFDVMKFYLNSESNKHTQENKAIPRDILFNSPKRNLFMYA